MQQTEIPVAAVQTIAHDRVDFERVWPHVLQRVERAARDGAKLVVLPEGTVPGYVLGSDAVPHEQLARAARELAALARACGTTVVYGAAKIVEDRTFNAAIAVGPDGREIGHAAKQFLWHFDRRWFVPGESLEPVDTPLGRLGLLVCADGRIPTIAATLVERGARALVMPTAWVTSGRDPAARENVQADLMANVRARENGVPFVVANKAGVEVESVAYCGKSAAIAADGAFLARAGETDEAIVRASIVLAPVRDPHDAAERTPDRDDRVEPVPSDCAPHEPVSRARIAFTAASDPATLARLAARACEADAGGVLARAARLAGIDLFVWDAGGDAAWHVPVARTRAAELRAYVVVFTGPGARAFAVDPDGAVVAGTFADFRMATFAYDRARAGATLVAPGTDVLDGLRVAEAIRARVVERPRR